MELNHEQQYEQIVESFFRNNDKGEAELMCYIELASQVDYEAFKQWREK